MATLFTHVGNCFLLAANTDIILKAPVYVFTLLSAANYFIEGDTLAKLLFHLFLTGIGTVVLVLTLTLNRTYAQAETDIRILLGQSGDPKVETSDDVSETKEEVVGSIPRREYKPRKAIPYSLSADDKLNITTAVNELEGANNYLEPIKEHDVFTSLQATKFADSHCVICKAKHRMCNKYLYLAEHDGIKQFYIGCNEFKNYGKTGAKKTVYLCDKS